MTRSKKLATVFAGVLALAPLLGTSAFAESRHRTATANAGRDSRPQQPRQQVRQYSRGNRNYGVDRVNQYNGRQQQTFRGRVSRIEHDRGGYRVWVGGGAYPIFIPEARWRLWPLQVGASIGLGGYWDQAGYYDAYDYSGPYYTSGDLHGIVESVDYGRGTVVLRDDVSGSFVTILLRGSDPRLGALQPGQYVDLSGAWNRAGVFDAYSVLNIQGGYTSGY